MVITPTTTIILNTKNCISSFIFCFSGKVCHGHIKILKCACLCLRSGYHLPASIIEIHQANWILQMHFERYSWLEILFYLFKRKSSSASEGGEVSRRTCLYMMHTIKINSLRRKRRRIRRKIRKNW